MKTLQIKTAQNVNLNFTLANAGQRLLAFFIDNIIKLSYLFAAHYLLGLESLFKVLETDNWTIKAVDVLIFLPITFYSLYTEILLDGQTIGKRFLHLKIINIDGFKPSITDHLIRWFLRIIDFNSFTLLYVYIASLGVDSFMIGLLMMLFILGKLVGLLLILFTKNQQRFGDLIANTAVIFLKDDVQFSETILEEISTKYIPTYPNVIKLSDNDVRIIKGTFNTAKNTSDFKTLIKLRSKILEVTNITSVHKTDIEFIEAVLKDFNYYTQNM